MPVIDGLPVPEPLGQVPPRAPGPGTEEDPVDHHPVIGLPATPAADRRAGIPAAAPIPCPSGHDDSVDQALHRSTPAGHQDPRDTPRPVGTCPDGNSGTDRTCFASGNLMSVSNPSCWTLKRPTPASSPEAGRLLTPHARYHCCGRSARPAFRPLLSRLVIGARRHRRVPRVPKIRRSSRVIFSACSAS
jgi:hypothetical protein